MSVALWPRDKKLACKMNEEFAMPNPVWSRLWFLFGCCYGESVIPDEQWRWACYPDIEVDDKQRISAQQVQEILRRIDAAMADGMFDRNTEEWRVWKDDNEIRVPAPDSPAWGVGDLIIGGSGSGLSIGTAAKLWLPRFLEFVRTLGINGFSIQG